MLSALAVGVLAVVPIPVTVVPAVVPIPVTVVPAVVLPRPILVKTELSARTKTVITTDVRARDARVG
jgi:hypothetical protein